MVIMENYSTTQDRILELWQEIDKRHLSYLEMEESSEKLEERIKLEECIHDFLCVATHYQKFSCPETQEVLQRSASHKKDFSGYKAATGFNAIQMYAGNLLSQPWRKEYRQIKAYSGFYKHQIESTLVGAEKMFEAMGYRHYGEGLLVLDGPICPDRVATVSKDCLIAYMECQILKTIWEEVYPSFTVSWLEVLEFRKAHICSPLQSINSLKYKHSQRRQYQEHARSYSQGSDQFSNACCQPVAVPSTSPVLATNHSFPPIVNHHHIGLPPPQEYIYESRCCTNNFATYGPGCTYMSYGQPIVKPQVSTNGYYYNGYVPAQLSPGYQYAVPTAQLIELESQNGTSVDVLDRPSHKLKHSEVPNTDMNRPKNIKQVKSNIVENNCDKNDSQFEDWGYVYRNLESQGYSKDLGERGDVLSPNSLRQLKEARKMKATNVDEAFNNLTVSDKPLRINGELKKVERERKKPPEVRKVDKQTSPSSSYDNLVPSEPLTKTALKAISPVVNYAKTKSLPRDKINNSSEKPVQSKTLDVRKIKEINKKKEPTESAVGKLNPNSWHCKACTFLNDSDREICEMCGKSRTTTVEQPIEIGGSECSQCTLVNPKNLEKCEACNNSLKDSPTYI